MNKGDNLLAGCVILYNPDFYVIDNIASYINTLGILYLVDNSEMTNTAIIDRACAISTKVVYLAQNTNIGVAAALNIGARQAISAGYKWLLTMDQDSNFPGDEFFDLWEAEIEPLTNVGLIAASYTEKYDRWQKNYSNNFNEIHFAVTSGNIINLKAWEQVNGFEEKLFIDEVDHDYCLKLRQHNYHVLITKKKLLNHAIGHLYKKSYNMQDDVEINLHAPVRYYYMSRNVLYLCRKYMFTDFKFVAARFYYLLKSLIKVILRYPRKGVYLKFFFSGIKDFAGSNYYKYKK